MCSGLSAWLAAHPCRERSAGWGGCCSSWDCSVARLFWWRPPTPSCGCSVCPKCWLWRLHWERSPWCPPSCSETHMPQDPQFGDKLVTLMAALVLVLQIAMAGQRWIVTNIRIFAVQSFLLAAIAAVIAGFNHAPHIFIAAGLTLIVKAILVPIWLERLVERFQIRREIRPIVNAPLSILICGALTLVGYVVAESFHRPEEGFNPATLGHNILAVAIALFLIGFFTIINRPEEGFNPAT